MRNYKIDVITDALCRLGCFLQQPGMRKSPKMIRESFYDERAIANYEGRVNELDRLRNFKTHDVKSNIFSNGVQLMQSYLNKIDKDKS